MITRRKLMQTCALGGAGLSVAPPLWWPSVAAAAMSDSNDPGFDLRGVNARYVAQGAPFAPFLMKFAKQSDLQNLYEIHKGRMQMSAFKVRGHANGNKRFLPLGDAVSVNGAGPQSIAALLLAPGDDPTALRNPVGFEKRTSDHGSGLDADLAYFQPIPPPGYTALGVVFFPKNADNAALGNYWCVRTNLLKSLSQRALVWDDKDTNIKDDARLFRGVFSASDVAVPGQMFILPNTLIGAQTSIPPYALVTNKLAVPGVKTSLPGAPVYDPDVVTNDKYSPGIARVMVLPCTAVSDPSLENKATESPFYYVVNRHVWMCTETESMPEGGKFDTTYTLGTSETQSSEFKESTSWTVGSSVGLQAGQGGGVSASVSASFTQDFSLTTARSATTSTQEQKTLTVYLPKQPVTQFWQLFSRITMYRGNGTLISSVEYGKNDHRLLPGGTVVSQ